MNRQLALRPLPVNVYRAVASAGTVYAAFSAARRMMGPAAPTMADIKTIYRYSKSRYRRYKSRPVKFASKTVPRQVRGLKNQVRELRRVAESDMGTLIFRDREASSILASVNEQEASSLVGSSTTLLEEVLAQLRYYNPSAPSSLVTADGATGTYQKEFHFKRNYSRLLLRNNYQVPVKVTIYICSPKGETTISPLTAWTNGLTDISNATYNSTLSYPTDSQQFNDLYKVVKVKRSLLHPGNEYSCSHSTKSFSYDPSLVDSHGLSYHRAFKSFLFLTVVQGVIGHDTSLSEYGVLASGVDVMLDRTYEVQYAAGADIKYVYVTGNLSAFTNGGVVSNKPVSDNQGYSVS